MLTDYHVHLRPDEPGSDAERFFTAANIATYKQAAADAGIGELGIAEHVYRFTAALDVWDHPFWRQQATDDLDAYVELLALSGLKVGIEADFVAGATEPMRRLLESRPFDYVVGSVHFMGTRAVDHPDWDVWSGGPDPDLVWSRYFELLAAAARSELFDIIAHPDLVKVWGGGRPRPEGDLRRFWEPAVEAIAESGVAVEISTAGLRKPVAELYPGPELARALAEAGVPFALSSDAHLPKHLGYAYDRAVEFLGEIGVGEICVFEARERRMERLG